MKRLLLMFIFCITSFIIFTSNVNASITTASYNEMGLSSTYITPLQLTGNQEFQQITFNSPKFKNVGEGTFIFTIGYACTQVSGCDNYIPISSLTILADNIFVCDQGTIQNPSFAQNPVTYTFKCNVKSTSTGITSLRIYHPYTYVPTSTTGQWVLSDRFLFVSSDTNNYQDIVNAITTLQTSMISGFTSTNNNLLSVISSLQSIYGTNVNIYNLLEAIKNNQGYINSTIENSTNSINNNITDSSIDNNNTSSSASSWANKNATNGTITNLLTLPISLLQNILNGIQTSCNSFSLGTLFGTELILPCINLSNLIGSTLFSVIDLLFSGFMILNISKKLIKIFNDFTNLKSNQIDEIYSNGGGSN